jgi:hypothetical protein
MESASEPPDHLTIRHDKSEQPRFRARGPVRRGSSARQVSNRSGSRHHPAHDWGLDIRAAGPGDPLRAERANAVVVGRTNRVRRRRSCLHRVTPSQAVLSRARILAHVLLAPVRPHTLGVPVPEWRNHSPWVRDTLRITDLAPEAGSADRARIAVAGPRTFDDYSS